MKLKVVSPYGREASSMRVRVLQWLDRSKIEAEILDYLGSENWGVRALTRSPRAMVRAELALRRATRTKADVVLIHRYSSPLSRGDIERRLLAAADRGVLDFDDALQWDWRSGPTGVVRNPLPFIRAAKSADIVIAGNAFLANWAAEWCREVVLIPSCVEPDDYVMKDDFVVGETPRLGWIGSPSTEAYLRLIEAPLLELHRRTGAVLVVISGGERSLGPLDQMAKRVPWSMQTQARLASLMDVGLMPLEDSLWTRGKCGYKLLQYGAAGVPAVASPFGVNAGIAASLGYRTACSSTDWIEALSEVMSASASDRATEGARARSAVIRAFSYEAWLPAWMNAVVGGASSLPGNSQRADNCSVL